MRIQTWAFLFYVYVLKIYVSSFTILVANDMHTLETPPSETFCSQEANIKQCSEIYYSYPYKYGNITKNPPISLTRLLLDHMQQNTPKPDVFILLGDLPAHQYAHDFEKANKTNFNKIAYEKLRDMMTTVTNEVVHHYPATIILPVFGNNDFKYNYQVPKFNEKIPFYKYLFRMWFENHDANSRLDGFEDIRTTFMDGGYYKIDFSESLRFIVLNTMYYARANIENRDPKTAKTQLDWFRLQLKEAKEKNIQIVLIYHIFPGYCYGKQLTYNFKPVYSDYFNLLLKKYRKNIVLVITGHTHVTSFRAAYFLKGIIKRNGQQEKGYYGNTFISPAISPVYKNNPGYSTFYLDPHGNKIVPKELIYTHFDLYKYNQQEEFSNFEVPLEEKSFFFNYSFTKTYDVEDLSAKSVKKALNKIERNMTFYKEHLMWTLGVKEKQFFEKAASLSIGRFGLVKEYGLEWSDWLVNLREKCKYFCVMREIKETDFELCTKNCESLPKYF